MVVGLTLLVVALFLALFGGFLYWCALTPPKKEQLNDEEFEELKQLGGSCILVVWAIGCGGLAGVFLIAGTVVCLCNV